MASFSRLIGPVFMLPAVFLVAGCDDLPKTWSRNDIQAIAADAAEDAAADAAADAAGDYSGALESRIETLEAEVARLKSENSSLQSELSSHSH